MKESLFLSTGDKRLDNLISPNGKGFHYTEENPIRILIKGNPGTGKSSLSCQIAIKFVENHLHDNLNDNLKPGVLYYTLDEPISTVANRISHFNPDIRNNFLFHNDLSKTIAHKKSSTNSFENKCIFISQVPSEIKEIFAISKSLITDQKIINQDFITQLISWDRIAKIVNKIKDDINILSVEYNWSPILIIIDSINSLLELPTSSLLRSTLRSLIDGLNNMTTGNCFVFVAEITNNNALEEYLTDAVILTELNKKDGARSIAVTKARDHIIRPTRHKMLIDDKGIRIIPHFDATVNIKNNNYNNNDRCLFGLDALDRLLILPIQARKNDNNHTRNVGIIRGTTTLIVGPSGTRKILLGMQFLRTGYSDVDEHFSILSFAPQETGLLDVFHDFYKDKHPEDEPKIQSLPNLIEDLEDIILRNTVEATKIPTRLLIHDISIFFLKYNKTDVLDMFRRLRNVFNQQNITAIFVMSELNITHISEIGGDFAKIADNVISTSFVVEHGIGSKATALCVRKFRGVSCTPHFIEYAYNSRNAALKLDEGYLADVVESENGDLSLGELRIDYFVGETRALHNYAEHQEHLLTDHFPGSPDECPKVIRFGKVRKAIQDTILHENDKAIHRQNLLQSLIFHPTFSRRNRSEILMFDHPWKQELSNILIPLNEMLSEEELRNFMKLPHTLRNAFQTDSGDIIGLPYYHNYYVLSYRSDLLKGVEFEPALHKYVDTETGIIQNEKDLKWIDIFKIADTAYKKKLDSKSNKIFIPFVYDDYTNCCLASLFLSLTGQCESDISFIQHIKIIRNWIKLAYENKAIPASLLKEGKLFNGKNHGNNNQAIEAVFSWRWYAQVLDMKYNFGQDNVHCLDARIAPTILGSWGLGILDGSLNIQRALATIRLLLSYSSQRKMVKSFTAIPSDSRNWKNTWFTNKEQKLLINASDRTKVKNYSISAQLIADTVNEFLQPIAEGLRDKGFKEAKIPKLPNIEEKLKDLDHNLKLIINYK